MFSFAISVAFEHLQVPWSISIITCQCPIKESQMVFKKFPDDAGDVMLIGRPHFENYHSRKMLLKL